MSVPAGAGRPDLPRQERGSGPGGGARPGDPARRASPANPLAEARRIAAAVRELPEVADVHSGGFGKIATLGAGGRVSGVRVTEEDVTVGVTVRTPFSADDVAAAVRAAVASPGCPVHVVIADVLVPEAPEAAETESENRKETVS